MPNGKPRWTDEARRDLAAILAYIATENPDAALSLLDRIEDRTDRLPAQPLAHRTGRLSGTRELVVHPNYIVVYAVADGGVTILRILHSARNWP